MDKDTASHDQPEMTAEMVVCSDMNHLALSSVFQVLFMYPLGRTQVFNILLMSRNRTSSIQLLA